MAILLLLVWAGGMAFVVASIVNAPLEVDDEITENEWINQR